jgi:hypothetical protein
MTTKKFIQVHFIFVYTYLQDLPLLSSSFLFLHSDLAFFFLWGILHYVFIFVYFCTICLRSTLHHPWVSPPKFNCKWGRRYCNSCFHNTASRASLRNLGVRDKSTWASFPHYIYFFYLNLFIFIFSTYLNLFFSSSFCDPVKSGANCLLCPPLPS